MLTDLSIRAARAGAKPYKLFDGRGLFLLVTITSSRLWRWKYRYDRKERVLALGRYPAVSLKAARLACDAARSLLATGVDPSEARRVAAASKAPDATAPEKLTRTLEAVARQWWAERARSERWDEGYAVQVLSQLERDLFPIHLTRGLATEVCHSHELLCRRVGLWPFDALTAMDVLEICRKVEARGSFDAARDLRSRIGMIYERERVLGGCTVNPAEHVAALLAKPTRANHPTITYRELPEFFGHLDAQDLDATTRFGIEGILATWLRSTELREARWPDLHWDARELRIPATAMKNGDKGKGDHIVPLSDYALNVFRSLHAVTGHQDLMFPSLVNLGEPISDGTWLNALYRMGYRGRATIHGVRALGSTTANESYVSVAHVPVPIKMWESRWIDRQLDHVDKSVSGTYNRAEYLEPRRALMAWWGQKLRDARALAVAIRATNLGLQSCASRSSPLVAVPKNSDAQERASE